MGNAGIVDRNIIQYFDDSIEDDNECKNADNMENNVGYIFTLLHVVEFKGKLQKRIISTECLILNKDDDTLKLYQANFV